MNIEAVAVVIPAHDEEALLPAALAAVAAAGRHPDLTGVRLLTVVVADSCRDRTAEVARRSGAVVVTANCGNPGLARATGTEWALRELASPVRTTWIAITDADSVVPADWLAYHRARAAEGWEAVVGTVALPATAASSLVARHHTHYEATRPSDGSPWRHPHIHGANLGLTAAAYRAVGGFPPLDVGEDRALVAALDAAAHRVLRTPDCPVLTSPRLRSRTRGGFADHLAALPDREAAS
ncbi:Glycosyl transferase family 2 [Streptomyces sp. DvalAA-14]|uniref:glycosyltransferase n=1 Tax=unclassified Streptomyces TaxID=2593676 RepID=UPI00081B0A27|nr:glycosyltransferase [Streptomyces sp. DvalAA-14]MYS19345.1 glycosyltransferase [Streptomyces sp. SID4948]SCD42196.1 Glycosyl transferase family 2 [Streptomyces sp. DvalAA-14]